MKDNERFVRGYFFLQTALLILSTIPKIALDASHIHRVLLVSLDEEELAVT